MALPISYHTMLTCFSFANLFPAALACEHLEKLSIFPVDPLNTCKHSDRHIHSHSYISIHHNNNNNDNNRCLSIFANQFRGVRLSSSFDDVYSCCFSFSLPLGLPILLTFDLTILVSSVCIGSSLKD